MSTVAPFLHNVWSGVDRRAFHENTIILEVEQHLQDIPIPRTNVSASALRYAEPITHLHIEESVPDFLDDVALLASGNAGPENVCGVCLENDDRNGKFTIRLARNEGVQPRLLEVFQNVVQTASRVTHTGGLRCRSYSCPRETQ